MANDIQTLVIPVDATADDVVSFKCSDVGGAITLLEAYAVNHATTSGTVSYNVALHKRTAAGTVIAGTIATAIGGTAATGASSHWTDLVPKTFTLDSTYRTIDDGECVSVAVSAIEGGSPTRAKVIIHYAQGKA
jgi:hypothetical protein